MKINSLCLSSSSNYSSMSSSIYFPFLWIIIHDIMVIMLYDNNNVTYCRSTWDEDILPAACWRSCIAGTFDLFPGTSDRWQKMSGIYPAYRLTCIVVKGCRYIFRGVSICSVADNQRSFANCPIPYQYTFHFRDVRGVRGDMLLRPSRLSHGLRRHHWTSCAPVSHRGTKHSKSTVIDYSYWWINTV